MFHSACQRLFVYDSMSLMASLVEIGGCWILFISSSAALMASVFASSFSVIPMWPGIHMMLTLIFIYVVGELIKL